MTPKEKRLEAFGDLEEFLYVDTDWRLRWRVGRRGTARAGSYAGYLQTGGYEAVKLHRILVYSHRVIFRLVTGRWPVDQLDHKNGVRNDNRFKNLREATILQNHQNKKMDIRNTTGHTGVYWVKDSQNWRACVKFKGKTYHGGMHQTYEAACLAADALKAKLHTYNPVYRMNTVSTRLRAPVPGRASPQSARLLTSACVKPVRRLGQSI